VKGHEGTPWVSIEVERAGPRDSPFGWIVTGRTPGHLACAPCMTWDDALEAATLYLNTAVRREVPTRFTKAEPLPPARRLAL
jgi:hypothetical protein